ncbi:hypothetical protein FOCC_FOCC000688 [Frankliniella occidentalis]|nr:hypothetical protein FOCC_FOCC000688 [Frankliniella occidentalis]
MWKENEWYGMCAVRSANQSFHPGLTAGGYKIYTEPGWLDALNQTAMHDDGGEWGPESGGGGGNFAVTILDWDVVGKSVSDGLGQRRFRDPLRDCLLHKVLLHHDALAKTKKAHPLFERALLAGLFPGVLLDSCRRAVKQDPRHEKGGKNGVAVAANHTAILTGEARKGLLAFCLSWDRYKYRCLDKRWLSAVAPLKDVHVVIPKAVRRGEDATLKCEYDLEGERLYQLKWYKGQDEFFRYTPGEGEAPFKRERSSRWHVTLHKVNMSAEGRYACEVSADAPSFSTSLVEDRLIVVDNSAGRSSVSACLTALALLVATVVLR